MGNDSQWLLQRAVVRELINLKKKKRSISVAKSALMKIKVDNVIPKEEWVGQLGC